MNMRMRPAFTALFGLLLATPAFAQHSGHDMSSMPGMVMPAPTAKPAVAKPSTRSAAKKPVQRRALPKATARKKAATKPAAPHAHARTPAAHTKPVPGMDMSGMDHSKMDHAAMDHGSMQMNGMQPPSAAPAKSPDSMQGMDHGGMDHSGMHMDGMQHDAHGSPAPAPGQPMPDMDHGAMDHSTMNHGAMDHSAMDHSAMDHRTMDHGAMHHEGTDMSSMPGMATGDLPADAAPRTPVPALSDADRAAAVPPAHGHAAHDDRIHSFWLVDQLEARDTGGTVAWDATAWIGGDIHRAWLRTEGETEHGRIDTGSVELLYGHATGPWWDLVAGIRQDIGDGPGRTYAAFGVQGLAPYKFDVRATGYVGSGGRTAARLEAEYDTLLTNRLILQWRGEADLYGRDDRERGIGPGLSTVEAGARLRYEFSRRFAPYIGLEVERAFGGTADLRRARGMDARDSRIVAGVRFWF